jgi:hypothetical protein
LFFEDGNSFELYTNGLFRVTTIINGQSKTKNDIKLNGLTLNKGDEAISQTQLVLCESGNFILKGLNRTTNQWSILWQINDRTTLDC